jgi:molybdopterin-guanine dinucleotide biosynthesis protein B
MLSSALIPVVGFVAPSGTGKTQLLKALIADLKSNGFRLAVIKHSHHDFEIDKPGKDSYELRMSGAAQMLIASKRRRALIVENESGADNADLNSLIKQFDQSTVDIILVEGFKFECFEKIEVYRSELNQTPLFLSDPDIIAVASDIPIETNDTVENLDLNNIPQISKFVIQHFRLSKLQR